MPSPSAEEVPAPPGARDIDPIRVAVVGGGCAGLTAAYELTRPEHRGRYEVTVYQMGWRLGGKGASGRGDSDRIEEHGLHLWMGFYENAFRLMRDCYAALPPDESRRLAKWDEAFVPAPHVGVSDMRPDGSWDFWVASFPPGRGTPGDPRDESNPFTVAGYVTQSVALVVELLRSAADREVGGDGISAPGGDAGRETAGTAWKSDSGPDVIATATERLFRYGRLATTTAVFEAADALHQAVLAWTPDALRPAAAPFLPLLDGIAAAARRRLERMAEVDDELRRLWTVVDLILAVLRGATMHALAVDPRGFDAVNEYDWREWLRLHGASEQSLQSGFMRGIYDLCFAFEDGDVTRPKLAAGVALRGAMRMFFTYRGALFWRMSGGMGDVVFAPLFDVLSARGVRFEFFHELRNVGLSRPRKGVAPHVTSLDFDVQAKTLRGRPYRPLVRVHDVPSWPARPDFGQLEDGTALRRGGRDFETPRSGEPAASKTLEVGKDFDFVVLGVPVAVLPAIAGELIEREPKWAEMVRHAGTVPTQALQVWLSKSTEELGWCRPQVNLSGFVEPFDTWADMRHLLPEESFTAEVRTLAYFCSVLPDAPAPEGGVTQEWCDERHRVVGRHARDFLQRHVGRLWPGALDPEGGFDWRLLVAGGRRGRNAKGHRRLAGQYWTANVRPSDRYSLSLPGSLKYRLSPLDQSFDNLTIAGDWTATGLDSGCIESAVMSGMLAAHALSGAPPLDEIVGYDHP